MATTSSVLGQYEANKMTSGTTDRVATDKDTFLKLLVAQLTHQDPLNPVEDKEFIAQLAQFTTVEELQNINQGITDLNSAYLAQQATNAASLINKMVIAGGDNIKLNNAADFVSEDEWPGIYFTLPRDSAEGTFNVYATTADGSIGNMVYSATMPGYQAGRYFYRWDGRDFSGNVMTNGTYIVNVTAKDADGQSMLVNTSSGGVVIGVETAEDGNHLLYLGDGRTVNFTEIDLIMDPGTSGNGTATQTPEELDAAATELEEAATAAEEAADDAESSAAIARKAADAATSAGAANAEELETLAQQMEAAATAAREKAEKARKEATEARKAADEAKKAAEEA